MTILEMKRVTPQKVRCTIEHQGRVERLEILVDVGEIRSFRLTAPTPAQGQLIHNSAYSSAFARRLWQVVDGAELPTPISLNEGGRTTEAVPAAHTPS